MCIGRRDNNIIVLLLLREVATGRCGVHLAADTRGVPTR